jgi:hypothetical protein
LVVERLEMRDLLTVVGPTVTATEGYPFIGTVATFTSTDIPGSSYQATIAWGDGHSSMGTVSTASSPFTVTGTNTYAVNGTYPVTVTIVGQSTATAQGQATVSPLMLQVTGTTIAPTLGRPFAGVVASFTDPYPALTASSYVATIDWGDGHATTGSIVASGQGGYTVSGTNTYTAVGTNTVTVTVVRAIDNQTGTATSKAIVVAPSLTAQGTTITATAGQPFTGAVASFTDSTPQTTPANYQATIAWGDGHSTSGTITANGRGGFDVSGTNVYQAMSTAPKITVTILRIADGLAVTASSTAIIAQQTNALTGQLAPASNTGAASIAPITAINQPTIVGTATPFAIVNVFARRSDQAQPVALGQAVTDVNGLWQVTIGPLPDGSYALTASETPPAGQATPMVALTPGSRLTIDTQPPAVLSAHYSPQPSRITVVLKDSFTGLALASVTNPVNYALLGAGQPRLHPSAVTMEPSASVRASNPVTVTLQFAGLSVPRSRFGRLRLALGKLTDLAGNPVSSQFVRVSTGHGSGGVHSASRVRA